MDAPSPGDLVLLFREDGRTSRLMRLEENGTFPLDGGPLRPHASITAAGWGGALEGVTGRRFLILRPTTADLTMKVKRQTQILYPKDYGYLIAALPVEAGSRVIEMGSGSGALAVALARLIGPPSGGGRLFSYDRSEEFQEVARKNLTRYGLADRVEWKVRHAGEPFDETGVDAVVLDLPEPWVAAPAAAAAAAGGGGVAAVCPTAEQVQKTVRAFAAAGLLVREVTEILERRILARETGLRPADRMIGHTCYLILAARRGGPAASAPATP